MQLAAVIDTLDSDPLRKIPRARARPRNHARNPITATAVTAAKREKAKIGRDIGLRFINQLSRSRVRRF